MSLSPTRIDDRWVQSRAELRRLLLEYRGVLPEDWHAWGDLLLIQHEMPLHPFAPWTERAGWYIEQIEQFLKDARAKIKRELAPYQDAIPERKVA